MQPIAKSKVLKIHNLNGSSKNIECELYTENQYTDFSLASPSPTTVQIFYHGHGVPLQEIMPSMLATGTTPIMRWL